MQALNQLWAPDIFIWCSQLISSYFWSPPPRRIRAVAPCCLSRLSAVHTAALWKQVLLEKLLRTTQVQKGSKPVHGSADDPIRKASPETLSWCHEGRRAAFEHRRWQQEAAGPPQGAPELLFQPERSFHWRTSSWLTSASLHQSGLLWIKKLWKAFLKQEQSSSSC